MKRMVVISSCLLVLVLALLASNVLKQQNPANLQPTQYSSQPIYPKNFSSQDLVQSKKVSTVVSASSRSQSKPKNTRLKSSKKEFQSQHISKSDTKIALSVPAKNSDKPKSDSRWIKKLSDSDGTIEVSKFKMREKQCEDPSCMIQKNEPIQIVGVVVKTEQRKFAKEKAIDGTLGVGNGKINPIVYVE